MGAKLDLGLQLQAVLQEEILQKAPGAGFALQQDQRELGQLLQAVGVAEIAAVVRRGDED